MLPAHHLLTEVWAKLENQNKSQDSRHYEATRIPVDDFDELQVPIFCE